MATLLSIKELTLIKGSADYGSSRTYQRLFRLVFASRLAGAEDLDTVADWAGLPAYGSALKSGDARKLIRKKVAALDQTGCEFLVTCDYEVPAGGGETLPENPVDRPDEVSFDGQSQVELFIEDHSDTPKRIVNSLGFPLERLPERTTGQFGLTIRGNRSSVNPAQYALYLRPNSVNNAAATVRGIVIGAREAKLTAIRFSRAVEGSYKFWAVEWQLALAPSWDEKLEDRTFYVTDFDGIQHLQEGKPPEPIRTPWPLVGGAVTELPTAKPDLLTFKPYPARDFSVFAWTVAA